MDSVVQFSIQESQTVDTTLPIYFSDCDLLIGSDLQHSCETRDRVN